MGRLFVFFALLLLSFWAESHNFSANQLVIDHPWSPPTPPVVKNAAVYLKINNLSEIADTLNRVTVSEDIAKRAEIHLSQLHNGVARMLHQKGGVIIAPQQSLKFQPGSFHIMLLGLTKPLEVSQKFAITLWFEQRGNVPVEVWVEEPQQNQQTTHYHE